MRLHICDIARAVLDALSRYAQAFGVSKVEPRGPVDRRACGPAEDILALVALIHEGVFEQPHWSRFLRALRLRLRAAYANVIFRRPDSPDEGLIEWSDTDGGAASAIREHYHRSFTGLDPFPYFRMEPGRVMRMPDLMGGGDYRSHPYFRDFLQPNGLEHMLLFRVVEPRGHQLWVTVTQPYDGCDFSPAAADMCAQLASHFATAVRCYGELEAARITRDIRDRVMHKLDFGCVTVDARRYIVRQDESVMQALQSGLAIAVDPAGKVRLSSASADREFGLLLSQIEAGKSVGPQAIVSDAAERLDILVVPMDPAIAGASAAIATVYFQRPISSSVISAGRRERLRELFGLSATEATLALCLVEGRTLAEAAAEIPITLESARTYSKRIFAKTGTGRQADLVRLLLKSVAALA